MASKHRFRAKIKVVGINPCVRVPRAITNTMTARKGYIAVKGKIGGFAFVQTLVPVKNQPYRLFVNGPMLKGAKVKPGDVATFEISEDDKQRSRSAPPMPQILKEQLVQHDLAVAFSALTPTRRKMILQYFHNLKTEASIQRNVAKLIQAMKENDQHSWMTRK